MGGFGHSKAIKGVGVTRYGILEIMGEFVRLHRVSDGVYQTTCPFHDDPGMAMYVWPSRNRWQCVGSCLIGGSADDFLIKIRGGGAKPCYQCGSPHTRRVLQTPDEERFGFDMWRCDMCDTFQNRRGD